MAEVLPLGRMARRLHVPRDWLLRRAKAGDIPSLKAGRQRFFSPPAVLEAMARLASRTPGGKPRGGTGQSCPVGLEQVIEPTADAEAIQGERRRSDDEETEESNER